MELFSDPSLPFHTLLFRLLLSIFLGLCIGIEREMHRQPAGMRTHILICIGSTVVTIASMYLPLATEGVALKSDAARIAAQIMSGIGFLGAGAIVKFGATVRGITTAATIWVTAAIGIIIGLGLFWFAVVATVFVLIVLVGFESFEQRLFTTEFFKTIELIYDPSALALQEVRNMLKESKIRVRTIDLHLGGDVPARAIFHIRISEDVPPDTLLTRIASLPSVRSVRLVQEYR